MNLPILVGTSILSRLLSAALCRSGPFIFQKLARLRRIDAAISSGSKSLSPELKLALQEFEVVIGSYRGELTIRLKALLEELERSGLVTAIGEAALIDRDDPNLAASFEQLYSKIFGNTDDAMKLYGALFTSFRITLHERFGEKRNAALLQSCTKEISSCIALLADRLSSRTPLLTKSVNYETIAALERKLARSLHSHFREIRVETNKGAKSIDIGRIYIPSKLQYRKPPPLTEEILAIGNRNPWSSRTEVLNELTPEKLTSISYLEFKDGFRRVVVLGDPGGGKSTLCQYLCYQLAKASGFATDIGDDRRYAPQNTRIPLHIVLRSFELARKRETQLTIFDYLLRDLQNYVTAEVEDIRAMLLHALSSGTAVLAFDGLDEILETARRREFVALVTTFANQFPLCPVIITSRLVGYQNAPMPDDFDELVLQKFDVSEIEQYVTKFLTVYERTSQKDARARAKLFVQQTVSNANDLRQNPLLLGLMAFLFSAKGDVPANRPEIYKECATLMFEKWDQNRDIKAAIPEDTDLLHLFADVASKIYGNVELEEGVNQHWLLQNTEAYFRGLYENPLKARTAARAIVEFLTGRSWVMSEFGQDVYKFTHRTFLEYFYARYLDEAHETVSQMFTALRSYIVSSERDVVAHLAIQTKSFRNQRRTIQTLTELESVIGSTKVGTKSRQAATLFAAHALEYLPGPEPAIKALVTRVFNESLKNSKNKGGLVEVIVACCSVAQERRRYVLAVIADLVVEVFHTGTPAEVATAASLCSSFEDRFGSRWRFPSQHQLPYETVKSIRDNAQKWILQSVQSEPLFERLRWEWYCDMSNTVIDSRLLSLLPGDISRSGNFDPAIKVLVIAFDMFALGDSALDEESRTARQGARALLSAIGQTFANNTRTKIEVAKGHASVEPPFFGTIPLRVWQTMLDRADDISLCVATLVFLFIQVEMNEGTTSERIIRPGRYPRVDASDPQKRTDLRALVKVVQRRLDQQVPAMSSMVDEWFEGNYSILQRFSSK